MPKSIARQGTESGAAGMGPGPDTLPVCPMASMCKRMMDKPPSSAWALVASAVLIGIGLMVFIEPRILVWLAGFALVMFGAMLFMAANLMRKSCRRRRYDSSANVPG